MEGTSNGPRSTHCWKALAALGAAYWFCGAAPARVSPCFSMMPWLLPRVCGYSARRVLSRSLSCRSTPAPHQPAVTATIVGPRTADQLTRSLRAPEITLTAETLRGLDAIWPGPGGEALEAYAW